MGITINLQLLLLLHMEIIAMICNKMYYHQRIMPRLFSTTYPGCNFIKCKRNKSSSEWLLLYITGTIKPQCDKIQNSEG